MAEDRHLALVDIAAEIGLIAEMPHWITAGMATALKPGRSWQDMTLGELLSIKAQTAKLVNSALGGDQ